MKSIVLVTIRLIILATLYFICFAVVSAALIPQSTPAPATNNETGVLLALLAVSVVNTAVLAFVILRSHLAGWRLALSIFVIFFGVSTFMSQIETAVFVTRLSPGMLPGIVLSGLVFALILSPLAVLVLGKHKSKGTTVTTSRLQMPASQWLLRLTLLALSYVIIYFTFGYYVAWKNPAVQAYYHGTDPGNFFAQIKTVLRDTPWLPLFQFFRGILWTALALPVIRMMKGQWWETGLAVALVFGVLMTVQLLIPNPIMPKEVRMAHLWETASSNFLFGWLVVLVLVKWRSAAKVATPSRR